jgi:hypothetical protein
MPIFGGGTQQLAAGKHAYGRGAPATVEQAKINLVVRAFHPFLHQDVARLAQHPRATGARFAKRRKNHDAWRIASVNKPLVGRLGDERVTERAEVVDVRRPPHQASVGNAQPERSGEFMEFCLVL